MLIPRTRNPCIPSSFVRQLGRIWWDLPSVYFAVNAGRISYQMLLFLQLTFTIIRHEPKIVTDGIRYIGVEGARFEENGATPD